ncbi:hypothetical protein RND71_007966 [Anisodus tanguticus]|uniref:Uncharacterized protein n=1 Tax=Anisodus tanguticus TaxID=243964 RepID=A0AAE1SMK0_9SOLA|nr:hypothetical protein RND71_007966 [Anisodus tanguticus]
MDSTNLSKSFLRERNTYIQTKPNQVFIVIKLHTYTRFNIKITTKNPTYQVSFLTLKKLKHSFNPNLSDKAKLKLKQGMT